MAFPGLHPVRSGMQQRFANQQVPVDQGGASDWPLKMIGDFWLPFHTIWEILGV